MLARRGNWSTRVTVEANKGCDSKAFNDGCWKLKFTPHVADKDRRSMLDGRMTRHGGD